MNDSPREEFYEIEGHEFVKRYADGGVTFWCDGRELDVREWNVALNKAQPMSLLEEHANPLVRLKETHRRAAFLGMIGNVSGSVVADVGCEKGHLSEKLAGKCKKLFCVDIDEEILSQARSKLGDDGVEYVQSDIRKLALDDDSVDICIAAEVLEHLPDPRAGIDELVRVTRPQGRIYISVPNERLLLGLKRAASAVGMIKSLGRLSGGIAVGHVQIFTKSRLREICKGRIKLERVKYSAPFYLNVFARGTPVKRKR